MYNASSIGGERASMIAVCICTHNPPATRWRIVVDALARQSAPRDAFHVIVVDNGSCPLLGQERIEPLLAAGIRARIVVEPQAGLSRARLKAIAETDDDYILFVDDDNELAPDYVENAIAFALEHPRIGAFGGRLILPEELQPADWVLPFLPSLGIRDHGDQAIVNFDEDRWGEWEPAGAGAVVHRSLLDRYVRWSKESPDFFKLGRSGRWGLASCDDSLMMRAAPRVGLGSAYVPTLSLRHHLNPRRFGFLYLMRLHYGYGQSFVRLDRILYGDVRAPKEYTRARRLWRQLKWRWLQFAAFSWQMRVAQLMSDLGRYNEYNSDRGGSVDRADR